ncbi:MAG: TaqI-like C-terminal specificity domain-containing protein [Desulfobacterales bacterium]
MNIKIIPPRKSVNKAFLKQKTGRKDMEIFKAAFGSLLKRIDPKESEEFHKNLVSDFLKKTWYDPNHFINTKGRNDLVIHTGKNAESPVGVILETKKPGNKSEMPASENINVKAFQELVLYYLRERITGGNLEIKYLIATDVHEWFIFDAALFEKAFAGDKQLVKIFSDFEAGRLSGKTTDFFYREIAAPAIAAMQTEIRITYFDIRDYQAIVLNDDSKDDSKLIALFKLLSPEHLLKLPFVNDSNSLDKSFYSELLHIIGLTERKKGNRKLIERSPEKERSTASLLENTITQLDSLDKISRLPHPDQYGENDAQRLFHVGLELVITWMNRILFLKLLEAQLLTWHKGDRDCAFLNLKKIRDFDDLNTLFFQVLARKPDERSEEERQAFARVPYLNSSLFEPTELEHCTLFISNLRDDKKLPLFPATVLKDEKGKKCSGAMNAIEYLFAFLNAYDFSGEGSEAIQEENKSLINAAVLGLIFEKINGYKDGSFFTPGFVTMYMCRETIRRAVVQKFNEEKQWNCKTVADLYDKIEDREEAIRIINSLKICDPAVGSGHFLVSALNEMIALKSELKVLTDRSGKRLKEYEVEVVNDELIVTDEDGELFEYRPGYKESQRVQETLFHEKQTIIENCLFGVDINSNSVKICRLRLWIELLKNAYYKPADDRNRTNELETLPNIDINIKCGNSLISRFALDADLKMALKKNKGNINAYKIAVQTYRQAASKEEKRSMEKLIAEIRSNFEVTLRTNDPLVLKLDKLKGRLSELTEQYQMFGMSKSEKAEWEKKVKKLTGEIQETEAEIENMRTGKIYENAFEWRFEFPEVLNNEGDFVGFDVVIGNPPYFSLTKIKEHAGIYQQLGYQTYSKGSDIYCLFYERGNQILKKNGLLTYITSNSWLRAIYGELLKKYFKEQMQPITLLNIEDIQVFEEATVESNIITLKKSPSSAPFPVCNLGKEYNAGAFLADYFSSNQFEFVIPESSEWVISNQESAKLKVKIESDAKLLKEYDIIINFGIKTGYNTAFIIDEDKKNELIEADSNNAEIIKPIIRGRDLKKYSYEFAGCWAICTFPSLKLNIDDYPVINNYFIQIGKTRLEQSGNIGSRKKTSNKWFETQDPVSYWEDFEKPKIIWGEISDKPKFAYDEDRYYAEATTFIMTGEKLKYLLGILNSKLSEWYFNQISTTTGMGTNRWKKYKIELLPIKSPNKKQENEIENMVNRILTAKKQNPKADTTALEKEIDRMVYKLYGLTKEEIAIVEQVA